MADWALQVSDFIPMFFKIINGEFREESELAEVDADDGDFLVDDFASLCKQGAITTKNQRHIRLGQVGCILAGDRFNVRISHDVGSFTKPGQKLFKRTVDLHHLAIGKNPQPGLSLGLCHVA